MEPRALARPRASTPARNRAVLAGLFAFAVGCQQCGPAQSPVRMMRARRLTQSASFQVDYRAMRPIPPGNVLLVNDPDAPSRLGRRLTERGIWLGYLSIGQIHEGLPMVPTLRTTGAVLGSDPHWPGALIGDPQHPAWYESYIGPRSTQIAGTGFQGAFLDTLDSALCERPGVITADEAAMATIMLVRSLRREHPDWLIVPNGGLSLAQSLRADVDGWALEDVFGGYDWDRREYRPTLPERQNVVLPILRSLRDSGLPIFVQDYAAPDRPDEADAIRQRCLDEGFRCAVSDISLAH